MDKVALFNEVLTLARPAAGNEIKATSLDDEFYNIGVDSLDVTMIVSYMSEIYGISSEDAMAFSPKTVGQLFDCIDKVKTKDPQTVEEALSGVK
jgi:acyl carrier protein